MITIPGEPCAQGRPRATVVQDRARLYDPPKSRSWKGMARVAMQETEAPFISDGPISVTIRAYHTCPKGDRRVRNPAPQRWRAKKPDAENVAKAVLDAATGVLWRDDAQIAELVIRQYTCAQDEGPRVEIEFYELPEVA